MLAYVDLYSNWRDVQSSHTGDNEVNTGTY